MKRHYKLSAMLICLSMAAGSFSGMNAFAYEETGTAENSAEVSEDSLDHGEPGVVDTAADLAELLPTGYIRPQGREISPDEIRPGTSIHDGTYMSHPASSSKYAKYSNDYYYDQMSADYQEKYNILFESCVEIMEDYWTDDVEYTDFVEIGTREEADNFAFVFMIANPQFYFCTGSYWTIYYYSDDYSSVTYGIALGVDDNFQEGMDRKAATKAVFDKADSVIALMNKQENEYYREKYAHDWIVENAEYDYDGMYDNMLDQSCYSTFVTGLTVCAGYADAFAMLCNGSGIPCICVTSDYHEWNVVNLYGSWYIVDCTWDDPGEGYPTSYQYFNISYDVINSGSEYTRVNHTYEDIWDDYEMPDCSSSFTYPGTVVNVKSVSLEDAVVKAGKRLTMKANVLPENALNKRVTWSLEDAYDEENNIYRASITPETGILTANSAGRVTVVATSEDGQKVGKCTVLIRFTDVTNTSAFWYEPVYWASDAGITYGIQNKSGYFTTFGPAKICTRQQMVTFLWRLAGCPEPKSMKSPFTDVTDTGAYYYKAVLWAAENGIAKGYDNGTFKPTGNCLRRQAVMFLWRMAGEPDEGYSGDVFADVPQYNDDGSENIWYKPVMWAAKHEITTGKVGTDPLIFDEGAVCLRRQMVTFLYRFSKLTG